MNPSGAAFGRGNYSNRSILPKQGGNKSGSGERGRTWGGGPSTAHTNSRHSTGTNNINTDHSSTNPSATGNQRSRTPTPGGGKSGRQRSLSSGRRSLPDTQSSLRGWIAAGGEDINRTPARTKQTQDQSNKKGRTTNTPERNVDMKDQEDDVNPRDDASIDDLTEYDDTEDGAEGDQREENGDIRMVNAAGSGDETGVGGETATSGNEGASSLQAALGISPAVESTPRGATFALGTTFPQKKMPGSSAKRVSKTVTNPYAKAVPTRPTPIKSTSHDFHTYIRVQINVRGEENTPAAITRVLSALLAVVQTKDPTACFTKELNVRQQIYSEADFPPDFKDFYDSWSHWEHDAGYFLLPAPLSGNGRAYHGTVCLSSSWDGKVLLEQCVFSIRNISSRGATVKVFIKDLQVMRSSRNFILFGVPSNVSYKGVEDLLEQAMYDILPMMVEEDPKRYPPEEFDFVPDFKLSQMYVKNTPFVEREKNDTTPSWARLPLHFEVAVEFEEFLEDILLYMGRKKVIQQIFGDYAYILKNCSPSTAGEVEKTTMKNALRSHMAIVLSLGRVQLRGLENPDEEIKLGRGVDNLGVAKQPVYMTVRKIMRITKVNGIRFWQFICPTPDGGWCGYYACGKMCEAHKLIAEVWARSTSASIRFKCVSRGIEPDSTSKLLRRAFSFEAAREAERARYINGVIVTDHNASLMEVENKIKHCKWVDNAFLQERNKGEAEHAAAFLTNDPSAFNFQDGDSVRHPPSISGTTAGDTAILSVINPETGRKWEEGEKEAHMAAAIGAVLQKEEADDGSIASDETAGWEPTAGEYRFEGLDSMGDGEGKDLEIEEETDSRRELGQQLRQALVASGRVDPGEGLSLGQDVNELMRAAIAALASSTSPTVSHGQNGPGEGNTGADHQGQRMSPGGQGP